MMITFKNAHSKNRSRIRCTDVVEGTPRVEGALLLRSAPHPDTKTFGSWHITLEEHGLDLFKSQGIQPPPNLDENSWARMDLDGIDPHYIIGLLATALCRIDKAVDGVIDLGEVDYQPTR